MEPPLRALLACPACAGPLGEAYACSRCGTRFDAPDGIPNLRLAADAATETVRRFYERAPFPAYAPGDTLHGLRRRAEQSVFAQLLDRAIPGDARVIDVGCGTGQMCLYLARADRIVIGVDLTRASLLLAAAAADRFGVRRVQFVETDLHRPAVQAGAFDVVYSSGVIHHTADPRRAFGCVARLVRPGGVIVLGVYNRLARIPARVRRLVGSVSGYRLARFDSILRTRQRDPARRDAWLRDQYHHPEEHSHTLGEVQQWFEENRIDYLRAYPSAVLGDQVENLFSRAPDDWRVEGWLAQLGWMRMLGREGGLFFSVGRRL